MTSSQKWTGTMGLSKFYRKLISQKNMGDTL
jgi:hypothetical protein